MARSRLSDDGREPLGRDTDSNVNVRPGVPAQRPALCERRPRHSSSSFNSWEVHTSPTHKREKRQNRRATGASADEKDGCNERSRSEQTVFSPATGDHPIACRSAVNKRDRLSGSASASLRFYGVGGWIWVYLCDQWAVLGGWVALRLCVSASLRFFWCSPLVSWRLGGFSFSRSNENPS
jgi:hypothetical protein